MTYNPVCYEDYDICKESPIYFLYFDYLIDRLWSVSSLTFIILILYLSNTSFNLSMLSLLVSLSCFIYYLSWWAIEEEGVGEG